VEQRGVKTEYGRFLTAVLSRCRRKDRRGLSNQDRFRPE